jgi:hypothetical protein
MECYICFENIIDDLSTTSCGHHFHKDCITEWALSRNRSLKSCNCPKCNMDIPEYDNHELLDRLRRGEYTKDDPVEYFDDEDALASILKNSSYDNYDDILEHILMLSTLIK